MYPGQVLMPKSFLHEILRRRIEPPWFFELAPIHDYDHVGRDEEQGYVGSDSMRPVK
jgi:hypothetical protein